MCFVYTKRYFCSPGPGHDVLTGRYACYDIYGCSDGKWVAVGAIEGHFYANLCRELGCEQWIEKQYDDAVQDEIRAAFAAALASRPRDEWVAQLAPANTCVAPVWEIDELVNDPQFVARKSTRPPTPPAAKTVCQANGIPPSGPPDTLAPKARTGAGARGIRGGQQSQTGSGMMRPPVCPKGAP